MSTVAYCYASGEIGFAKRLPNGALPILRGPEDELREFISAKARHAYDGVTLLVPGVPEAPNKDAALNALLTFIKWIEPHWAKRYDR